MKTLTILIFILITYSNLFSKEIKNVLILNSYHKGFEFSDTIIKNIEKVFYDNQNINLNILYMDSKQIYTREYRRKLNDLYSLQLKNKTYDLVIPIDRFAYKFIVKNYQNLFHQEKILFVGIEKYSKELAQVYDLKDKINGIIQKLAISENIAIINNLFPKLKKLYILNGRSENANDSSIFIIKAIQKIKDKIEVEYIRDYTLNELKEHFKVNKKDEAILFVHFSNDKNGSYYRTNEVSAAIKEFKLPVFATDSLYLGKGIVGGNLVSMDKLGIMTGKLAIELLNKGAIEPAIQIYNSHESIYDFEQLKKFNINIPSFYKDAKIINTPKTFFERHKTLINSVFLGTPVLLVIIFGLLESLYSKRKATKKLKQRLEFDQILLNAIDSPIYWEDKNGKILDMNKKFCQLVDLDYSELIGKNSNKLTNNSLNLKIIRSYLYSRKEEYQSNLILKNKYGNKNIYFIKQTSFKSNNSDDGIVTIFTDITKEKKIEQEKEKQTQYIIQQSKMAEIGEIFSSIAHQWKSPLVTITALAQDMFYTNNKVEKESDSYHIKNIMLQANYMTDTINEFQDFIIPSKEKTVFNVHKTIDNMLNIVKHNMKYNYINIKIEIQDNSNLEIYGFENEFMQAILNIVNNAKEALLQNSEKNRNLTILLKNKYKTLVIDFIDNGSGIKDENRNKIFQQYFSTKDNGHGIGLYMTKIIIQDKLKGKIFYKKIETGSRFRIILKTNKDT